LKTIEEDLKIRNGKTDIMTDKKENKKDNIPEKSKQENP